MSARRRWGKAGVRLTEAEAHRLDARANRARAIRAASNEAAYREWAAGRMVPARITIALDAMGLDGPEVDAACLAAEPDVDRWEAGELYPTWEQVEALARLTGVLPKVFMWHVSPEEWSPLATTLRFHVPPEDLDDRPLVQRFTPEAISARLGGAR